MTNGNTFHLQIYHLPLMVNSFLGIQKESVKKEMQEKCEEEIQPFNADWITRMAINKSGIRTC